MARRIDCREPGFEGALEDLIEGRREETADVRDAVSAIIAAVREEGDAAVLAASERFDRIDLATAGMAIGDAEIEAAWRACPPDTLEALEFAAARIRAFHEAQRPEDRSWVDTDGVELGMRWRPVDAVGLYVPGGTAAYPSSVLMNAIPARVAGCARLVMTVPTPDGVTNPLVLAAARLAGVDEVYRIGGAQAIAAMAYGTASIRPVDVIVGPGNAYVAEAKRQVFGRVGIDMIAGPSEIVVVSDGTVDPAWIAADLLSQAEHDAMAQAILVTADKAHGDAVQHEIERQLVTLERGAIASASWSDHGAIVIVEDLGRDGCALVDRLAPEHLELALADPEPMAARIRHAGSIFKGPFTPEVIGDYVGGPNHVLPTARTARFASGLSVFDFLKRTTLLGCGAGAFAKLGPAASVLARAEGLQAHALAVERRLEGLS